MIKEMVGNGLIKLDITKTDQVQDGCVTASARAFLSHLGVNFDNNFLPQLQEYTLDPDNPENNHMLGVAVVAAELGFSVRVHTRDELSISRELPANAPELAKRIHPEIIDKLYALKEEDRIELTSGSLSLLELDSLISSELENGKYVMVILNWDMWNKEAQKKFGNPRHIVTIFGHHMDSVYVLDPSVDEEYITSKVSTLYNALVDSHQIISIGNN